MYINFERLLSSGMTAQELLYLLAVRQKEKMIVETIPSETIEMFRINGWIEGEKTMKLTKKGTALLDQIETAGLTSEISLLLNDLTELYKSYGKDIGISVKEAESRLIWFIPKPISDRASSGIRCSPTWRTIRNTPCRSVTLSGSRNRRHSVCIGS